MSRWIVITAGSPTPDFDVPTATISGVPVSSKQHIHLRKMRYCLAGKMQSIRDFAVRVVASRLKMKSQ
jgi:hypothetical protein